jgi:hypothetical protein
MPTLTHSQSSKKVSGPDEKMFEPDEKIFGPDEKMFGPDEKMFGPDEKMFGPDEKMFGSQLQAKGASLLNHHCPSWALNPLGGHATSLRGKRSNPLRALHCLDCFELPPRNDESHRHPRMCPPITPSFRQRALRFLITTARHGR